MINEQDISKLLEIHSKAYSFLIHLANKSRKNPETLSARVVDELKKKKTCVNWLEDHINSIPVNFRPENEDISNFAGILSSFFVTSFKVDNLNFEGKLLDSDVKTITRKEGTSRLGQKAVRNLALKHLCRSQNIRITEAEARKILKNRKIHMDITIWAYVWELDRRARGKPKGSSVHILWRDMPYDIRKNLNVDLVMKSRQRLLEHAKSYLERSNP